MESNSNLDKLGSVKELIRILEKCDKTVLQLAKEYDKNLSANSFRKTLGKHIILKIDEHQKSVPTHGQGDTILSITTFNNMIHLINFQKSVLDLLTPTTQKSIDMAILPLTQTIPPKDFDAHVIKMIQNLREQFATIQASINSSNSQEQPLRPIMTAEKRAHLDKVFASMSMSKKSGIAIDVQSQDSDDHCEDDL
jgi:hypothetical protein